MMVLYYTPGACSMAAHTVLEESGEKYEARKVDLAGGQQRTKAYLKMNPLGRVPVLRLDNGEPLAENTAILPSSASGSTYGQEKRLLKQGHSRSSASLQQLYIQRTPTSVGPSDMHPTLLPSRLSRKPGLSPFMAT